MPAKEKKGAGGRPSKFDSLDLTKVKLLASRGWTDAEMAEFFGVNPDTWYEWKKKHPEFSDTLKDWKFEADHKVERSLYERATGYNHPDTKFFMFEGTVITEPTTKHYPPDTTAAIFWLKNRQPDKWRDKTVTEGEQVNKIEVVRRKKPIDNGDDSD